MNFDPKELLNQFKTQLEAIAIDHIPVVLEATQSYLDEATDRLTQLAEGDFESDYIKDRLAEEGDIFKEELISYEVFGEMIAKDAQDSTIATIISTLLTIVSGLITPKVLTTQFTMHL